MAGTTTTKTTWLHQPSSSTLFLWAVLPSSISLLGFSAAYKPTTFNNNNGSCVLSSTIQLTVQFDGGLRPPRDPGYPTLDRSWSAYSACISLGWSNDGDSSNVRLNGDSVPPHTRMVPLAVGGGAAAAMLPVEHGTTSQHVEYEGVILGLEWLCQDENRHLVDQTVTWMTKSWQEESGVESSSQLSPADLIPFSIVIEGDCRTVVDQLSGRSVPRKLQELHQRAASLVATVGERLVDFKCREIDICYNHIPRKHNIICDRLCNYLMDSMTLHAYKTCVDDIQSLEASIGVDRSDRRTTMSSLSSASAILVEHLDPTRSMVPHSLRLPLYQRLAFVAKELQDYELLLVLGRRMCHEAKRIVIPSENPLQSNLAYQRGMHCQIAALQGMGQAKDANRLQHKHRVLLRKEMSDPGPSSTADWIQQEDEPMVMTESWDDAMPSDWLHLLDPWMSEASRRIGSSEDDDPWPLWTVKPR